MNETYYHARVQKEPDVQEPLWLVFTADSTLLKFSQYLWVISYSPLMIHLAKNNTCVLLCVAMLVKFCTFVIVPRVFLMIYCGFQPKWGGKAIFHSGCAGCFDRCVRYLLKPFDSRLEEHCNLSTSHAFRTRRLSHFGQNLNGILKLGSVHVSSQHFEEPIIQH